MLPNLLVARGRYLLRKSLLVSGALLGLKALPAQAQTTPSWNWAQSVGGGVGNQSTCFGLTTDAAGNCYVTGSFTGTGQFGPFTLTSAPQTAQVYVAKISPAGVFQWVRTVGGSGRAEGQALTLDAAGNLYVTGRLEGQVSFGSSSASSVGGSGDVFVAKLSPAGTWLWAAAGGGAGLDIGRGVAVSPAGQVVVTGQIQTSATFGATAVQGNTGIADIFVGALDAATGTWQWSRCPAGTPGTNNYGQSIGVGPAGEVYIAGSFVNSASFGSTTLTSAGTNDVFVAKLTGSGAWTWARRAGGPSTDDCRSLALDAAGDAYLTGWCSNPAQFGAFTVAASNAVFVAKIDAAGNWQWVQQASGNGALFSKGIVLDARGQRAYITGNLGRSATFGATALTSAGPFDQFVAGLNVSTGAWQWVQQAMGTDRIVTQTLAADPAGNLFSCGYATGNATFGAASLLHPNPPAEQAYVARLATGPLAAAGARRIYGAELWPCPAPAHGTAHLRWAARHQPGFLVVRDVLGREVHRQALPAGATAASFPVPPQPGWYQCQVQVGESVAAQQRLLVQP